MSNTVTGRDGLMHMVSFESSEQEKNILSPISDSITCHCSAAEPVVAMHAKFRGSYMVRPALQGKSLTDIQRKVAYIYPAFD